MLTFEQQQALDELFSQVEGVEGRTAVIPPQPDFLQTWFGLSGEQLGQKWQEFIRMKWKTIS